MMYNNLFSSYPYPFLGDPSLLPMHNQSPVNPPHLMRNTPYYNYMNHRLEEAVGKNFLAQDGYREQPVSRASHTNIEKRKIRPTFNHNQITALEEAFNKKRYITQDERTSIASDINLTSTQVKVWFQNRRAKAKKAVTQSTPLEAAQSNPLNPQLGSQKKPLQSFQFQPARTAIPAGSYQSNFPPPCCVGDLNLNPAPPMLDTRRPMAMASHAPDTSEEITK